MLSKDQWLCLNETQKVDKIKEATEQLIMIDNSTHPLSHRQDQGRLCSVKKDLEKFLLNTLGWQSEKKFY